MARKPLPESERKVSITTIRLNAEERSILLRAAYLANAESLGGYIRNVALDHSRAVLNVLGYQWRGATLRADR